MRKILFILGLLGVQPAIGQNIQTEDRRNILKVNVLGFTSGSFSFQYERLIAPKTSVALGMNIMPERDIPYFNYVEDIVKDKGAIDLLKDVRMTAFSLTPEIRFYLGKEGLRGFYVAPFVRYDRFRVTLPVDYIYQNRMESVIINGNIDAFSAGLSFGAQWRLSERLYLDCTFIGMSYGFASGELGGKRPLNAEEQTEVRKALNEAEIKKIDYTYNVHEQGVDVKIKGPWANAKFALAVGYRF